MPRLDFFIGLFIAKNYERARLRNREYELNANKSRRIPGFKDCRRMGSQKEVVATVRIAGGTHWIFVVCCQDERKPTGRYLVGGAVLAITLLAVHHVLLQDASTVAGVCIPAIIMVSYIAWILYSAHRDRRKVTSFKSRLPRTDRIGATRGRVPEEAGTPPAALLNVYRIFGLPG